MILNQYYLGCLAHASYLLGDEESRTAVVVDPQRDIDRYLADARRLDLEIRHVFLSHFHADFLAGHLELRDQVGARIYLGSRAQAEYEFTPMKDRDTLEFGQVKLQILETPGHSPESISILVYDLAKDDVKPHAVLTGDTLFIGDVGRPDLRAALGWSADELGALLYDSVQQKLLPLPNETLVYPAHGAGSLCGKNMSEDTVSTIGVQRQYNYALQPMSRDEFVRIVTADQPDTPDYFTYDAILNTREHPTLATSLKHGLNGLSVSEVGERQNQGAVLLDTREPSEFAGAHWRGSINVGLQGKYATWAGTLLDAEDPIVLIAEPGREEESAMRLGRIGFNGVSGYLANGMMALESAPELIGRVDRITAAALSERLQSKAWQVIDVRAPTEWQESHIPGSVNLPLSQLSRRLEKVPKGEVVVHCASGYRSSVATSLIMRDRPETTVSDFVGGLDAWLAAGFPTE